MKYLLFIALILLSYSCNKNCHCKIEETNVNSISSIYDSFAEGDVETVVAGMTDDIEWNEAENFIYADGNPFIGPDAVVNGVFARLGQEWDYWNLENKQFYPAGPSHVLVTGRYQAKNKLSGKELDAQFAHIWTVIDGKASGFQQYTDTKQAAEAVIPKAENLIDEN